MSHIDYCISEICDSEDAAIKILKEYKCLIKKTEHRLRLIRKAKTDAIRDAYFNKKIKQVEIAKMARMRQGNVSKVISGSIGDRYHLIKNRSEA